MAHNGGVQTRKNANRSNSNEDSNQFSVLDDHSHSHNDDPRSPYYLSTGDHPGANLVPKILTDEDDDDFDMWNRCNSLVISWMLHAITPDIADSIMYMESASAIWDELQERFHQKNAPRIFEAKRCMQILTQGSNDVTTYYTRKKALWDQIQEYRPTPVCTCGEMKTLLAYQEGDRVLEFMVGLIESYTNARSQILLQDPLPSFNKA
ncbi:uncharacterized protein LOC133825492 [Humulus lupulus]|uniref:uncharacterized protein LOC133825492 n=1 Tax=Humulus lupulus TaxID=3486 RepID=UPI002B4019D3|nr:uncharacterized protein LOC133825492 [Humulus lupulus]